MIFYIAFSLLILAYFSLAIYTAPEGYEDENGFHYGKAPFIK